MLNTMMENEKYFANICCEHDLRKGIETSAKLVFSFSIILFNMMKFVLIPFIMKLTARINIFEHWLF